MNTPINIELLVFSNVLSKQTIIEAIFSLDYTLLPQVAIT